MDNFFKNIKDKISIDNIVDIMKEAKLIDDGKLNEQDVRSVLEKVDPNKYVEVDEITKSLDKFASESKAVFEDIQKKSSEIITSAKAENGILENINPSKYFDPEKLSKTLDKFTSDSKTVIEEIQKKSSEIIKSVKTGENILDKIDHYTIDEFTKSKDKLASKSKIIIEEVQKQSSDKVLPAKTENDVVENFDPNKYAEDKNISKQFDENVSKTQSDNIQKKSDDLLVEKIKKGIFDNIDLTKCIDVNEITKTLGEVALESKRVIQNIQNNSNDIIVTVETGYNVLQKEDETQGLTSSDNPHIDITEPDIQTPSTNEQIKPTNEQIEPTDDQQIEPIDEQSEKNKIDAILFI